MPTHQEASRRAPWWKKGPTNSAPQVQIPTDKSPGAASTHEPAHYPAKAQSSHASAEVPVNTTRSPFQPAGPEGHQVPRKDEVGRGGLQKGKIHQAPLKDRMVFSLQEDNHMAGLPLAADRAPGLAC